MRRLAVLFFISFVGFAPLAPGDFNRTTGLIDIPTAEWLDQNVGKVMTNTTFAVGEDEYPFYLDFGLGYGLFGIGEIVLNAYTSRDYSAHLALKLTDEKGSIPAIGIGVHELTYRKWISSVGGGDSVGFPDDVLYLRNGGRPSERFSVYLVATKDLSPYGSYTLGIGRGRFVGYGPYSHWFNTDAFRQDDYHGPTHPFSDLAFGLFMGARWQISPGFFLMLEFDGRDGNAGVRYEHRYFDVGLAGTHLDQIGGKPALNPRIALGLSANTSWMYELPGEGIVVVRVVDVRTNSPLLATISFPDMQTPSLQTSPEGILRLRLPSGSYTVLAGKDGYHWKQRQVTISGGRTVACNFDLEPELPSEKAEGVIACRVTDARTGSPLVATLTFLGTEMPSLHTSPEGIFRLKLPASTYTVEARKDGYTSEQSEVTVPEAGIVACNFALRPELPMEEADRDRLIKEHMTRGLTCFAADSLFEAASEWTKVLRLDPTHEEARRLLSRVRGIIRADLVSTHRVKAIEHASRGQLQRAIQEWETILSLDPGNLEAKTQIRGLKARLGPPLPRENINRLFRDGLSLFSEEKYKEALGVFDQVLKLDPAHKGASEYRDKAQARLKAMGEE